jgi:UDP-GlcNAc:undecaprenyl-phosphate GlcNAc-1-phosphate transferase
MISNIQFLGAFVTSSILCGLITPLMKQIAIKANMVDKPNQDHKTHTNAVPYLGGVAIILTIIIATLSGAIFIDLKQSSITLALSVILPSLFLGIIGLIDDIRQLSPISRFIAQTFTGIVIASFLIITNTVGSPTGMKSLDFLITIFWIVGVTNSINFFDNHDGGASGAVAIASFGLFFLASTSGQYFIAAIAIVLSGTCSGFLFWNRNPARIYMGDAGALFLGMMTASLLVRFEPNPMNRLASFSIPVFILAIPILDTTVAVLSRLRRGKSPFEGGKDHLSHRLTRLGLARKKTAISLWFLTSFYVLIAVAISSVSYQWEGLLVCIGLVSWLGLFFFFMIQRDE